MMFRFTVSFVVLLLLVPSSSTHYCHHIYTGNQRSGVEYSTWVEESDNARSSLTAPGNKITISPMDSFSFIPEIGYGKFDDFRRELQDNKNDLEEEESLGDTDPLALVVSSGLDTETRDWAKEKLGTKEVEEFVVPMPKSNLIGIELDIVSSEPVLKKNSQDMVVCHEMERGSYVCHKTASVDITEVTVVKKDCSSRGGASISSGCLQDTVWVACHDGKGCHVLNVADKAFIAAEEEEFKITNLRGDI